MHSNNHQQPFRFDNLLQSRVQTLHIVKYIHVHQTSLYFHPHFSLSRFVYLYFTPSTV